jgi:glycosyltransferase involved in cell wall biosynthesis
VLYPPRGGAEIRFLGYLAGLAERGVKARLFSGTPKAKKLTAQDREQDWYRTPPGRILPADVVNGVPLHQVRLPDKGGWRRVSCFNRALLDYCRRAESRPDVVQLIEPLSPLSTPWMYRLKGLGIARMFAYTLPYELPRQPFRKFLRQQALRQLYGQLDCVITGSAISRDHALKLGLDVRTEVIPNGVNLQRYRPVATEEKLALRAGLGLGAASRVMTTVGSIIPRKGIDLLLETWVSLAWKFPDLHFVLVGPRTDESDPKLSAFNRRLVELMSASGAGERVHFTGRVQNVEAYLQASDLFVFASEREGMANVILEAMACGLPVVMTPHVGLPPDFGRPAEQYLLAERNPESLATVVSMLLENNAYSHEIASNGRHWVEETMGLDCILDSYAALYHEMCARR